MFGTQQELVSELRLMAQQGSKPSEMLHRLMSHHPTHAKHGTDRNLLVQYFSEAFCFDDGQAYPIFGWLPDERGELKDANIDRILSKRIERTRDAWEKQIPAARASDPAA